MRIGVLLPSSFALGNPANGILSQARYQMAELSGLGHEVKWLQSSAPSRLAEVDVLHCFGNGYGFLDLGVFHEPKATRPVTVFSPIIDSLQSQFAYRCAAWLGTAFPRLDTIPGANRTVALSCDAVAVRSAEEYRRATVGMGVPPAKVHVVPNGVNPPTQVPEDVYPRLQTTYELPPRYVLHISAYTQPRKNVLRLAEACARTNLPLVVAGYSDDCPATRDELRQRVAKQELRLLPMLTDQERDSLYEHCDLFALPTTHEGTGLVALEAGAHGAKVLVTKNGGPPDYFQHYVWYVDPFSVSDIANQLLLAWAAPKSSDLQNHVLRDLTWRRSAECLASLYARYLGARKTPR